MPETSLVNKAILTVSSLSKKTTICVSPKVRHWFSVCQISKISLPLLNKLIKFIKPEDEGICSYCTSWYYPSIMVLLETYINSVPQSFLIYSLEKDRWILIIVFLQSWHGVYTSDRRIGEAEARGEQ